MVTVRSAVVYLGAQVRGHTPLNLIASAATAVAAAASPPAWTGNLAGAPAAMQIYYLLGFIIYLPYGLSSIVAQCLRRLRQTTDMRLSLLLTGLGSALVCAGFLMNFAEFGCYLLNASPPGALITASRTVMTLGLPAAVLGVIEPGVRSGLRALGRQWRYHRDCVAMRPLARDLRRLFPDLWLQVPNPGRRGIGTARLRRYRSYVLIRDALTRLSPILAQSSGSQTGPEVTMATSNGLAADLYSIISAGVPAPAGADPARPVLTSGDSDIDTILAVSRRYARQPAPPHSGS